MDFANFPFAFFSAAIYVVLFCIILLGAKWAKDVFTPYSLNKELAEQNNVSISLTMAGYYIGVALIFVSQLSGPSVGLKTDLLVVSGYSVLGILFLNLSRWINDKAILRTFCNIEKLTVKKNNGVGIIQFSIYVATGMIASGALSGSGSVLSFFVFFVLGQLALIVFSRFYNTLSTYDLYQELENDNFAAAISFAGALVGLGIIVKNSASGDFIAWKEDILWFATTAVASFIFLPALLRLTDRLVIPGKSLAVEIAQNRNIAAGLLSASLLVSFSFVLVKLF